MKYDQLSLTQANLFINEKEKYWPQTLIRSLIDKGTDEIKFIEQSKDYY